MKMQPRFVRYISGIAIALSALGYAACSDTSSANTTTSTDAGGANSTTPSSSSTGGSQSSSGGASESGGESPTGGAGQSGGAGGSGGVGATGGSGGAGGQPDVDKSQSCITDETQFDGDAFTAPFGRLDGTLLAVVKPEDQQCALPNSDHVTLEIMALGKVYRAVVNVESDSGPPDVYYLRKQAAMPAPAYAEGWHVNAPLDYPTDLSCQSTDFVTYDLADMSNVVTAQVELDMPISVYCATDGGFSCHDVHKNVNGGNIDGAIVVNPTAATPTFLLFHFDEQVF